MRTRFILIETSHAGNVGAAARAMKVMGFDELVLVKPRWTNVLRKEETIQRASGANDVLALARVVDSLDEAIEHINTHGSHHTEAILTTNHPNAMRFLREVDSSSVMVNASTRFADGFEYGLGAEIGISTDKFHARGPVGLEGLTSMKWVVLGQGEVRG